MVLDARTATAWSAVASLRRVRYLCSAKDNESYALGFTVRAEDKNAKWAKEVAQAAECEELAKYCRDEKKESLIPCWQ